MATLNAHYDLGVWLLEQGADPNADDQGWTALHQLVWARRPNLGFNNPAPIPTGLVSDLEFVEALVEHGADIDALERKEPRGADGSGTGGYRNVLNRVGATPFLLAAKAVDDQLMRLLVRLGLLPRDVSSSRAHRLMDERMPSGLAYPFHVTAIAHGREVCRARSPRCAACVLADSFCTQSRSGAEPQLEVSTWR